MERALLNVGTHAAKIAISQMSKSKGPYLRGTRKRTLRKTRARTLRSNPQMVPYSVISKRHLTDVDFQSRNENTLYSHNLSDLSQSIGINGRERQAIAVRGVRLSFFIDNLSNANTLQFRWAIIQEKGSTGGAAGIDTDFFRGTQAKRNVDYSAVVNNLHKWVYPINTDKYLVYGTGKAMLAPKTSTSGTGNYTAGDNACYAQIDRYIKVNSKLVYDDIDGSSCTNPLWLVFWSTHPGATNSQPVLSSKATAILYYKEMN